MAQENGLIETLISEIVGLREDVVGLREAVRADSALRGAVNERMTAKAEAAGVAKPSTKATTKPAAEPETKVAETPAPVEKPAETTKATTGTDDLTPAAAAAKKILAEFVGLASTKEHKEARKERVREMFANLKISGYAAMTDELLPKFERAIEKAIPVFAEKEAEPAQADEEDEDI